MDYNYTTRYHITEASNIELESSNLHHYIHFSEELQANIFCQKESPAPKKGQGKRKEFIFSVADHGKGIDKKDAPFIFDRFYCADKSRTEKQHFGLGLSIAKELSSLLGGKIGFWETNGGGATFYLKIPIS